MRKEYTVHTSLYRNGYKIKKKMNYHKKQLKILKSDLTVNLMLLEILVMVCNKAHYMNYYSSISQDLCF